MSDAVCVKCGRWGYYFAPKRCFSCNGDKFLRVPAHIPEEQEAKWVVVYKEKIRRKHETSLYS